MIAQSESVDDHHYFQAVEKVFVELRGTPFLLSPKDWKTTQSWHREGIPLEVVEGALREVFRRREERGVTSKVSSLSYCSPAVHQSWAALQDLMGPTSPSGETTLPLLEDQLRELANSLPPALPHRDHFQEEILRLRNLDSQAAESALHQIEQSLYIRLEADLDAKSKKTLDGKIARSLERVRTRLTTPEDREKVVSRIKIQTLRKKYEMPVLTLFRF